MYENKEDTLSNQLAPGDVLIVVPPTAPTEIPSFAAHLLQACCRRAGITVKVFYANLHFSGLIGPGLSKIIAALEGLMSTGERLFCASAFGLPPMGRNVHRLIDPDWFPDHRWQRKNETAGREMSGTLAPFRKWMLSVDWQHVEKQAAQWVESAAEQIVRMGYQVVGCTNTLAGLSPGTALLNHVKQANPGIITALGGSLCEGEMAEGILSLKTRIDYIFSGESDLTFPAFARDLLAGKRPKEKIIRGKPVMHLDEIPLPDYREYFQQVEHFSLKPPPGGSFPIIYETSRGCQWGKCAFCALSGERKPFRVKSPGIVINDLKQLANRHPDNPVQMTDTYMPKQYFDTLFTRMVKDPPSARIQYEVNPDLTLDQVITLKQAGVTEIKPCIESLSTSLLKRIRQKGTIRQNIALLRYACSVGVDVWWNLLFGIPGDQVCEYEEMLELIPLIRHLPPPVRLASTEITRFSLYQAAPETFGISNLRPAEFYHDVLPSDCQLEKIAYFFSGDFEAQSYEHPEIFARLRSEFQAWIRAWEPHESNPSKVQNPTFHLECKHKTPGRFVLHDTRGLPGRPARMVVDREQAGVLLVARPWNDSPLLQWAVDSRSAVLRESWLVPLATARPELLQEFEFDYAKKSNG